MRELLGEGRKRRRDDPRARRRARTRRLHDHDRGVRRVHGGSARSRIEEIAAALERLEDQAGTRLGDPDDPLLVSVRSGARESMPGMLDTVLNLGLNDESVEGLARTTGNERFAWDSYRRFVQMFGNVCRGIPGERYEDLIEEQKSDAGVTRTSSSTWTT